MYDKRKSVDLEIIRVLLDIVSPQAECAWHTMFSGPAPDYLLTNRARTRMYDTRATRKDWSGGCVEILCHTQRPKGLIPGRSCVHTPPMQARLELADLTCDGHTKM